MYYLSPSSSNWSFIGGKSLNLIFKISEVADVDGSGVGSFAARFLRSIMIVYWSSGKSFCSLSLDDIYQFES